MNRTGEMGTLITYERALFIQAEIRIVRNSTNERKQMSTKTTFKRIALVAVAALGLGVLSVAPSSAAVSGVTLTATNGATTLRSGSTTLADSDTNTGATLAVYSVSTDMTDTITVAFYEKSKPAGAVASTIGVTVADTASATSFVSAGALGDAVTRIVLDKRSTFNAANDSVTVGTALRLYSTASGVMGATFRATLDTGTALTKGTYTYTAVATVYSKAGASYTVTTQSADVSIVVSANANDSTLANAAYTTAYLNTTSALAAIGDSATAGVATAGTTSGILNINTKNILGTTGAKDTATITITGPGNIGVGASPTTVGKSVVNYQTGSTDYALVSDGNAGVATITVTLTTTGQSFTKTATFYSKNAATITTSVRTPILKVGSNSGAVGMTAVDSAGNAWTGQAYIVASSAADALIAGSDTPVACAAWNAADGIRCSVSALLAGTAKFKVIDAATVATAKALSAEFSLVVSTATAAGVKVEFDKATYGPYEKAIVTVYPVDATGALIPAGTYTNLLTSAGITANQAFSGSSDTLTSADVTTVSASSSTTGAIALKKVYTVYMPAQGTVTLTWTGGTSLPLAGQVKSTASVTIVNNAIDAATDAANEATDAANAATDAALAAADAADAATAAAQDASDAVAALSATVAKLVASLKAQITSLTNLVIKIQKKVKA